MTPPRQATSDRGRSAARPRDIPGSGWRDVLIRAKNEMSQDNLSLIAAGVAFYGLLAIFPGIAAVVSIYGLLVDPPTVEQQLASISRVLPADAAGIIEEQLGRVSASASTALSFGAIFGVALAIWSANKGTQALITALNIAYDEDEDRGTIKLYVISLALTLGIIAFVIVGLALIAALPALFGALGMPESVKTLANWLRWPALAVAFVVALGVFYRYAPSRERPRWRWVSWGALLATALWLVGSALFSWYVSSFGSYNETYGSVGAVVILMMWFWLSAYIVLIGAELNAELEHQTTRDTTRGPSAPMGERGAYVADTVGESP